MTRPCPDSSLWDFALWLYAQPGVSSLCVRAQDTYGVDVVRVLWLAWLDGCGYSPSERIKAHAEQLCAHWQTQVVVPLRGVRRWLKVPPEDFAGPAVEPFRLQVKALELEAERLLLVQLQTLVASEVRPGCNDDEGPKSLRDYLAACGMPEREREALMGRLLPWRQQPEGQL